MPTLDYLTGWNHQVASLGATQTIASGGAIAIDTSTVRRSGGVSLKTTDTNNGSVRSTYALSVSSTLVTAVVYAQFSALVTNTAPIMAWTAANQGGGVTITNVGAVRAAYFAPNAFTVGTNASGSVTTGVWYRFEIRADASTTPWTIDARYGLADANTLTVCPSYQPGTSTATTFTSVMIGFALSSSIAADLFSSDLAVSLQDDYPIGRLAVLGYSPNAVGTHNLDAATSTFFFADTSAPPGSAGTALTTSETTSYQNIDEVPLDTGNDAVKIIEAIGSPNTPTFRSAGTWSFTANNVASPFTCTPGAPAGKATGDLLLLVCESRSITATVGTPSGWNTVTNSPITSGTASGGRIYLFTRVADGSASDTPSPVWTGQTTGTSGDASGAGILAFTNLTATQDATLVSQDLSAQGASSTISGITTATDHSMVINVAMKLNESSGQTATVTTYTEASDNSTTSGTGHIVETSYLDKASHGASGSGTITWSATTSARALIATIALKATAPLTEPTNTWYAEYEFSGNGDTADPYAVRAIVAQELDTATTSTWAAKLFDSVEGSNTETISSSSISTTTKTFVGKTFAQRPNTGGAWTGLALAGTRLRFGYTAVADGNPRLAAAMLEAAHPIRSMVYADRRVSRNSLVRR